MPSTDSWPAAAVRPLDCGRRSPDDQLGRRPASAGRVDRACAAAGVSGVVARPRREVGEGLLSSTTTASLGRARRARWAAPHPQPSAPAPAHRSAPMLTAPTPPSRTADRPGDRARSRQRPWHSAVRSRPIYALPRRSLRASRHASRAACSARSRARLSHGDGVRPSAQAAPARGLLEIGPPCSPSRGVCAPACARGARPTCPRKARTSLQCTYKARLADVNGRCCSP